MKLYQQGDVLIQQVSALPKGAQAKAPESAGFVLAHGEITGHSHAIAVEPGVQLYTMEQILYLVADHDVTVTHQEHGAVSVPAGTYQIGQVREYDYLANEARKVRD